MIFNSKTHIRILAAAALSGLAACASGSGSSGPMMSTQPPTPDPRVGLKAGLMNAAEAVWNLRVLSKTPPPPAFAGMTNSDLAFSGKYAFQGSYNGYQVWDITDPAHPSIRTAYVCPASQSDVSVYKNLLFVSGEGTSSRIDCGAEPVRDTVSNQRLRGLRIFDITDIEHPRNVGNVQTCRGSHTHTVLADPRDPENVYIYISGSAGIRSPNELPGCIRDWRDPNSAYFRIEVIKVPVNNPAAAAVVSSPRLFADLVAPPRHGETVAEAAENARALAAAKAKGEFTANIFGSERVVPSQMTRVMLDSIVKARNGMGPATREDSATLRMNVQSIIDRMISGPTNSNVPRMPNTMGPTQCHDITVFPAAGLAGGACEGYGFLVDIRDPANPRRIDQVADSNFSYWHSATFNNDATKILFSDEWGGGGAPKCRSTDPKEWGADAIFTIDANKKMHFQSYYKLSAPQTAQENCVAHNGSLIPIPGRDVMVQAWYQGGISVFDWSDAAHPVEIAYFDRGPADSTRMAMGGSWSVYWYNGVIVSSEIARGLDIFELTPSGWISQNEIDAAKTVHLDYLNTQGQPKFVWPNTFALARAYLDQLDRSSGLKGKRIKEIRETLSAAETATGMAKRDALTRLAGDLENDANGSKEGAKIRVVAGVVRALAM